MFRGIRCSVNFILLKKSLPERLEARQHGPTALFLPVHSMPVLVCQLLYCTITVLFKVLYCKIKNVFFIFRVCLFVCIILCEKYYKPITVQYYIADCVSWVPRLTLVDL